MADNDGMASNKLQNFHLPLPSELYARLREEAETAGIPATALAREALEDWLRERRRQSLRAELKAYANAVAGTAADLDEVLERAGAEYLFEDEAT